MCSALIIFVFGELCVAFLAKHFESILFWPEAAHHFIPVVAKEITNALLPVVYNWNYGLTMIYPHFSFWEFFVASITSMEHAFAPGFRVDSVMGERSF